MPAPVNPGQTVEIPSPPADRSFTVSQEIARAQSRGPRAVLQGQFHILQGKGGK